MKKRTRVKEFAIHDVFRIGKTIYFVAAFPWPWSIILYSNLPEEGDPGTVRMSLRKLRTKIKSGRIENFNKQFYGEEGEPLPVIEVT